MRTLKQLLSSLDFNKACELLGDGGEKLLKKGGLYEIDPASQVSFGQHIFWLNLAEVSVTISSSENQLIASCSDCLLPCEHIGAAYSVILEEKEALGLADVSPYTDEKSGGELIKKAIEIRQTRASKEDMSLIHDELWDSPWGEYSVVSQNSGKTYKLAIRGLERGESYCSCPDYRCNALGTCKHIIFALKEITSHFEDSDLAREYKRKHCAVHLTYGEEIAIQVSLPTDNPPPEMLPFSDSPVSDINELMRAVQSSISAGFEINIYPDAEEYIDNHLFKNRIEGLVSEIRKDPAGHTLRKTLLKEELLPYQLEGIAFAAGNGRVIIADDMGLGKTVQGIGTSELLADQAGIKNVLIISPASLKNQWQKEIERFSNRSACVIEGIPEERIALYDNLDFYTICNYEQVLKDQTSLQRKSWDLIILDEGQRIKNYESKTSKAVKSLKSPYALVLSGTPLENRLDDLFSIVNFIDNRILGPAFQFFEDYQITDEKGKFTGYKNLDKLRAKLKPILLRRTRKSVLPELPALTEQTRLIPPTEEQMSIDASCRRTMQTIIGKSHISEMDLLRLRKAMTSSRMAADSPALVDSQLESSSGKLDELEELVPQLIVDEDSKILIFSEWKGMLDRISSKLDKISVNYTRVDGSLSSAEKETAVANFNTDPGLNVLLCSNTAGTGLNLQAADTVINIDLPWNPAKLEQRAARAHRFGQTRPVQVINLVTSNTIEERLLYNYDKKVELFTAALDPDTDICEVDMSGGMGDLRTKIQALLSSTKTKRVKKESVISLPGADPQQISLSGGNLLTSAMSFLADLLQTPNQSEEMDGLTREIKKLLLHSFSKNDNGEFELTLRFSNEESIDRLALALSRLNSLMLKK